MARKRLASEERRQAIVDAARPLFARKGFDAATTREIARAAGVSEALVFQHFPSKAALYHEILAGGCEGDPALERLASLEPSTKTLVQMTTMLLEHLVLNAGGNGDAPIKHRLTAMSYLEDGEYARLLFAWVMERVFPLFEASLGEAAGAGDLRPDAPSPANAFWLSHHVAASMAYAELPEAPVVPYAGPLEQAVADARLFILRGIGLTEAAIARHLPQTR